MAWRHGDSRVAMSGSVDTSMLTQRTILVERSNSQQKNPPTEFASVGGCGLVSSSVEVFAFGKQGELLIGQQWLGWSFIDEVDIGCGTLVTAAGSQSGCDAGQHLGFLAAAWAAIC